MFRAKMPKLQINGKRYSLGSVKYLHFARPSDDFQEKSAEMEVNNHRKVNVDRGMELIPLRFLSRATLLKDPVLFGSIKLLCSSLAVSVVENAVK
jgi:hypothetical protein